MNIGSAFKKIRKKLNLSQRQIADMSGIAQTTLSQIENGHKRATSRTTKKICNTLDIPELIVYILAMENSDVPESRKEAYDAFFPALTQLALQMVDPLAIAAL